MVKDKDYMQFYKDQDKTRANTETEKISYIRKTLKDKGKLWTITAIIEGSIGYYQFETAKVVIERFNQGYKQSLSERCAACYKCSLIDMLYADIRNFEYMEFSQPNKVTELIIFAAWTKTLNDHQQTILGLMYPTMIIS